MTEYLPRYMFQDCINLCKVVLAENITKIYGAAFENCEALEEVNLDNILRIGGSAFKNCKKLKSVYLPNIETLSTNVFSSCTGLTTVTLGSHISEFKNSNKYGGSSCVFMYCENLTDFYCHAETPPKTDGGDFYGAYIEYATLHVPASAIEAYRSTYPWSSFGTIVAIESTGLEEIDNGKLTIDNSSPLYNLQGQQVSHPVKGQIYIKAGKKVVVR